MVTHRVNVSDHAVCGIKAGFAEIFLMPQPPLLTRGINPPNVRAQFIHTFEAPYEGCAPLAALTAAARHHLPEGEGTRDMNVELPGFDPKTGAFGPELNFSSR